MWLSVYTFLIVFNICSLSIFSAIPLCVIDVRSIISCNNSLSWVPSVIICLIGISTRRGTLESICMGKVGFISTVSIDSLYLQAVMAFRSHHWNSCFRWKYFNQWPKLYLNLPLYKNWLNFSALCILPWGEGFLQFNRNILKSIFKPRHAIIFRDGCANEKFFSFPCGRHYANEFCKSECFLTNNRSQNSRRQQFHVLWCQNLELCPSYELPLE